MKLRGHSDFKCLCTSAVDRDNPTKKWKIKILYLIPYTPKTGLRENRYRKSKKLTFCFLTLKRFKEFKPKNMKIDLSQKVLVKITWSQIESVAFDVLYHFVVKTTKNMLFTSKQHKKKHKNMKIDLSQKVMVKTTWSKIQLCSIWRPLPLCICMLGSYSPTSGWKSRKTCFFTLK